jgi:hypothetical protein
MVQMVEARVRGGTRRCPPSFDCQVTCFSLCHRPCIFVLHTQFLVLILQFVHDVLDLSDHLVVLEPSVEEEQAEDAVDLNNVEELEDIGEVVPEQLEEVDRVNTDVQEVVDLDTYVIHSCTCPHLESVVELFSCV